MTIYLWNIPSFEYNTEDLDKRHLVSWDSLADKEAFLNEPKPFLLQPSSQKTLARYLDNRGCMRFQLISQYAADQLKDIWDQYADLYPVELKDCETLFYIVIPKLYLDCLDKELNTIFYFGNYGDHPNAPCEVGREWIVDKEVVGDASLFSIDVGNPYKADLKMQAYFVSEAFVERVKEADLEGFTFQRSKMDFNPIKTKAKKPRIIMPPIGKLKVKEIKDLTNEALTLIAQENIHHYETAEKLMLIDQKFLNRAIKHKQFDEALAYCDAKFRAILPQEYYEQITAIDPSDFPEKFLNLYNQGVAKAKKEKTVEALYFEYYYDGHPDVSDGNLFLCQEYDEEDSDYEWGSVFEAFIDGMSMCPYFDPLYQYFDDGQDDFINQGHDYIHMKLLLSAYKHLKTIYPRKLKYPLAFAMHDSGITYACP